MLKKKKKCYNQGRGVCPLVDYGGNMKKRVISIIRNIFDGVMIFVLFITTTVYALPSNGVIYDNSNSGSSATNVSEAIDDLYSKLTTKDNEINRLKGLGNVASNQMLKGYTALVKGSVVTGSIPSKGATTYTPGTTNQTIASGNYLSGTQTIKGDANLVAGNIKKGVSIFGVAGSYTPTGTNAGIHLTTSGTNYCGSDWKLTSTLSAGTYIVSTVMTNSAGVGANSKMDFGPSTCSYGACSGVSVTTLSENVSNNVVVGTRVVTLSKSFASGSSMGRMSTCSDNKYGTLYGRALWVKIS